MESETYFLISACLNIRKSINTNDVQSNFALLCVTFTAFYTIKTQTHEQQSLDASQTNMHFEKQTF